MPRPQWVAADDFGRFLQIARHLAEGKGTLREVALAMRASPQGVSDIVNRLEHHYGETLIDQAIPELTKWGKILSRKIEDCLGPIESLDPFVTITVAHALLQVEPMLSCLNRFRTAANGTAAFQMSSGIELQVGIELDDNKETERLLTGQLDLLLCLAFPGRIGKWLASTALELEMIGDKYPLALVSHDKRIVEACTAPDEVKSSDELAARSVAKYPWCPLENGKIRFHEIVKYRVATLDHDKQPLDEHLIREGLYFPRKSGKRRIRASSFNSVIEMMRARIADVGLVPLVSTELDALQRANEVFYQALPLEYNGETTGVQIAALRRKPQVDSPYKANESASKVSLNGEAKRDAVAARLVAELKYVLNKHSSDIRARVNLVRIPESVDFLQRLRHGYYLFRPDKSQGGFDRPEETRWCHEDLKNIGGGLKFDMSANDHNSSSPDVNSATIVNDVGDKYVIEEFRFVDGALLLVAKSYHALGMRTRGFIATFNAAVDSAASYPTNAEQNNATIVGTWHGGGGRDSALATWSIIFSDAELSENELNVIARCASITHATCALPQILKMKQQSNVDYGSDI